MSSVLTKEEAIKISASLQVIEKYALDLPELKKVMILPATITIFEILKPQLEEVLGKGGEKNARSVI